MQRAVEVLGLDVVARALELPPAALEPFVVGRQIMTLPQQRMLGLAVLAVSDGQGELRRRALALLGQVHAATAFESAATETHSSGPVSHRWR